jgi:hypothetical protein
MSSALDDSAVISGGQQSPNRGSGSQIYSDPPFEERTSPLPHPAPLDVSLQNPPGATSHPILSLQVPITETRFQNALQRQHDVSFTSSNIGSDPGPPAALISRDIQLTTTMDILESRDASVQMWFSFFVDAVECPCITAIDDVIWQRMKHKIVELGTSETLVSSAVIAVAALYRALLHGLPLSKSLSLYHGLKVELEKSLHDGSQNFSAFLVTTFLICLFDFINYNEIPFLKEPGETFIKRLEAWVQQKSPYPAFSSRLIAWLRILHVVTRRGGGTGLISDHVHSLLLSFEAGKLTFELVSSTISESSSDLYAILSTPVVDFYFQLQMISGKIAELTHYRRSRATGADQEDVIEKTRHLKSQLSTLWNNRFPIQHQTPDDLRTQLAPKIADRIITLIGVCAAAYYGEFVEIDRVLGDPVLRSIDSEDAVSRIREIVDGDWNAFAGGRLNSGYLRPLFLFAIECMDYDENQWAVESIKQIRNPFCRSDFFASFGKALSDAQLQKERRVTSKFFCIRYFGVPPPFL